jgi:hypothetical protein
MCPNGPNDSTSPKQLKPCAPQNDVDTGLRAEIRNHKTVPTWSFGQVLRGAWLLTRTSQLRQPTQVNLKNVFQIDCGKRRKQTFGLKRS